MPYYFSIPVGQHAGLAEAQEVVRAKLGTGARYQDPASFHITLAYVLDSEADLTDIVVPRNVPIFGMVGDWIASWKTPDGQYAIVIELDKRVPQLLHLQASIFYAVRERGLSVSSHSWPGMYRPHVTLAYSEHDPDLFTSAPAGPIALLADRVQLTGPEYAVLAEYPLLREQAGEAVQELMALSDVTQVWEFRSGHPEVPLFSGVNREELVSGDTDPMFLTLPVAEDDSTSDKLFHYPKKTVQVIEEQMAERRPIGILGHPDPVKLQTQFDRPAVYWVGLKRVGKTVWGKAYVPPGEAREVIREHKKAGSPMTTSIFAMATKRWDDTNKRWEVLPDNFDLLEIDLGNGMRGGVRSLAAVPEITSEFRDFGETPETSESEESDMGTNPSEEKQAPVVDRLTVIRELSAADAVALPETVRTAILEGAPERKIVAEMRGVLDIDESADVVAELRKQREAYTKLRGEVIAQKIQTVVTEKVKVPKVRGVVAELAAAKNPDGPEAVEGIVDEVMKREHIAELLKSGVQQTMGPPTRHYTPPAGQADPNMGEQPAESILDEKSRERLAKYQKPEQAAG